MSSVKMKGRRFCFGYQPKSLKKPIRTQSWKRRGQFTVESASGVKEHFRRKMRGVATTITCAIIVHIVRLARNGAFEYDFQIDRENFNDYEAIIELIMPRLRRLLKLPAWRRVRMQELPEHHGVGCPTSDNYAKTEGLYGNPYYRTILHFEWR